MGWTGIPWYDDRIKTYKGLVQEYVVPSFIKGIELLDISQKGSHVWLLWRNKETDFTLAECVLCEKARDRHEFLYKCVSLDCGPNEIDMPKSWIKKISPGAWENEYCKSWLNRFNETENAKKFESKIVWSKVPNLKDFECVFSVDCSAGKKGDKIKAWWDEGHQRLRFLNYGVSKNQIKKFFSEVKAL